MALRFLMRRDRSWLPKPTKLGTNKVLTRKDLLPSTLRAALRESSDAAGVRLIFAGIRFSFGIRFLLLLWLPCPENSRGRPGAMTVETPQGVFLNEVTGTVSGRGGRPPRCLSPSVADHPTLSIIQQGRENRTGLERPNSCVAAPAQAVCSGQRDVKQRVRVPLGR